VIDTQEDKLADELKRLKCRFNLGHELTLKWLPNEKDGICGEVKGECIHIYEEDEEKAIETLKHEFLDHVISKVAEPYQRIANRLIELTNEETYKRKEKLVECLCKLL
jgi:hypothetical protein